MSTAMANKVMPDTQGEFVKVKRPDRLSKISALRKDFDTKKAAALKPKERRASGKYTFLFQIDRNYFSPLHASI